MIAGGLDEGSVLGFAIALAIGALIGIEREQKKRAEELGSRGLRSFILVSEAGAIAAWLSVAAETPWIFVGIGVLVAAFVIAGYLAETRASPDSLGMTTEFAILVVYLLGGAVVFGFAELAVALAIATSAVLAYKEPLHGLVDRVGRDDFRAGLKLLIAAFIVLPVLPNRAVDPWDAINPYEMGWLVILIASLSLAGYVASRWLGPERGLAVAGLAGGMVSSTAVTLGFSRQSKASAAEPAGALAIGLLLAWLVMFFRVAIEVSVVHLPLLKRLALPLGAMALATLAVALQLYLRAARGARAKKAPEIGLKNPFSLTAAIRFALLFTAVQLLVEIAQHYLPGKGLYVVAGVAGLTDVDAITLSMAERARAGTDLSLAQGAILVAVMSNTLVKCALVAALGSRALFAHVVVGGVLVLACGIAALLFA